MSTLFPMMNDGPDEDSHLIWPGDTTIRELREAKKPKKPLQIMKAAMGYHNVKASGSKKPKTHQVVNLAKETKSKKRGPFGEAYSPVSAGKLGVRAKEAAPPDWEEQVKALKGKVENPYAVAWSRKKKSSEVRMGGLT